MPEPTSADREVLPIPDRAYDGPVFEDAKDPDKCNVYALYSLFATPEEKAALAQRYRAGGLGYGDAKKMLLEQMNAYFETARAKRKQLEADPDYVESVLVRGAQKARAEARKTMELVRRAVGMTPHPMG